MTTWCWNWLLPRDAAILSPTTSKISAARSSLASALFLPAISFTIFKLRHEHAHHSIARIAEKADRSACQPGRLFREPVSGECGGREARRRDDDGLSAAGSS